MVVEIYRYPREWWDGAATKQLRRKGREFCLIRRGGTEWADQEEVDHHCYRAELFHTTMTAPLPKGSFLPIFAWRIQSLDGDVE